MNKRRKAQKRGGRKPAPKPEGRPTKYSALLSDRAQKLYFDGQNDGQVATALGIARSTLMLWVELHKEFSDMREDAKACFDDRVESALLQRALGMEVPDLYFSTFEGEVTATPYRKVLPPDVGAAAKWLQARRPKVWREKMDTTVSNPDGSNLIPDDLVDAASRIARERLQAERDMGLKKQRRTSEDE